MPWLSSSVKPMRVVLGILGLVVFLNLVSWLVFCVTQGGDALNGKIVDGRYYLGSHSHYTEVSAAKYQFSRWQTISNMVTLPVVVGGSLLYEYRKKGSVRA